MPSKDKYTDPELRDEVKEEIHNSDKGGAPGQWSARKAQMMASEYKKRGGGYTTDKKDQEQDQKNLDKWTEEEWQTKEGSGQAKKDDGTEKRYLPKKAWEQMSEQEKEETDDKKQKQSKEGKQHVANTSKAKSAKKNASIDNGSAISKDKKNATDCAQHWEDAVQLKKDQKEYEKFKKDEETSESVFVAEDEGQSDQDASAENEDPDKENNVKKRGAGANQNGSNKKQKNGNNKDAPTGAAGDKTRVPKKGQMVQWKALPGFVDGEVVEVVYEEKTVEGKSVKASKGDPRIVLKSNSSGKIAVHKPEAVYFD